jgi:uncharacterized protein DUF1203
MVDFKCIPIEPTAARVIRESETDTFGNSIRKSICADDGKPCRECLGNGVAGDVMLLASYALPRPKGLYWTPSPIFVHEKACNRYEQVNHIPDTVRTRLVSLRSYDHDHQCVYDLGVVVEGHQAAEPLRRALADPRVAFVNIHTAKPGCLLCSVERA